MSATKAQELLARFWDRNIPVDPHAIARAAGIKVVGTRDLKNVSGAYQQSTDERTILYNSTESAVRQRFTIAHELGHWALDHGSAFRDPPENYSLASRDSKEIAANRFAAELLMPRDAVEIAVKDMKIVDIQRLATMFRVSQVAMKYRLQNLGLL